ncbi:hypothetical protein LXL04_027417 [Taraxacum kok-saghyz]
MASAAIFSSLRRSRSPSLDAFLAPVDLDNDVVGLLKTLTSIASDLISSFSDKSPPFQKKNSRSLIRKIELFVVLLDSVRESGPKSSLIIALSRINLLQKQSRRNKLFIDKHVESLRLKFFKLLNEVGTGNIPNSEELHDFFVTKLGILDARACRVEIEFLEEQIVNHGSDLEPSASILGGVIAMIRYCRFLLFGFEEDEMEISHRFRRGKKRGLISKEIADTFITIPKDFCCPISLDLMMDPVIISTGQAFDRASISRWIEEGHCNCPKTGQTLVHKKLVPNRALRNLIMQWCTAHKIPYSPPDNSDLVGESFPASRPAVEANKATVRLLIQELENGSDSGKAIAAREIRFLAKTGRENRGFIAESGVIPHLKILLSSQTPIAQENAVTAMLNLSIYDKNKSRIMEESGCLTSIVAVLKSGHTIESRENAAATLFSLSAVHEYKKLIADEPGALPTLAGMLLSGTPRGRKDAVTALFNLSTHTANCVKMIESGVVKSLVEALECDGVAEEAAGALALIIRQPVGAEAVGNEESAVVGLIGMMRCGTPRGKENAVAALLELCRSGGAAATERVVRAPALAGLIHSLLFTGTKRARRKAASLARVFQRCHYDILHFNGLRLGYGFAGNSTAGMESGFPTESVSVSMSMPMSVSVS